MIVEKTRQLTNMARGAHVGELINPKNPLNQMKNPRCPWAGSLRSTRHNREQMMIFIRVNLLERCGQRDLRQELLLPLSL